MLIWLENAPQFGEDIVEKVTCYIDKIITCQKPINNLELLNLINKYVHRHSHSCRKNTNSQCRFNYPQPPMRQSRILYPIGNDIPTTEINKHKDTWKSIKKSI